MMQKRFSSAFTILAIILFVFVSAIAQESPTQQPTEEEQAKQKAMLEKNAYRLLDQVIDEAQSLRLPENRIRMQITAADLIWDHNQERARSLFSLASDGIVEMMRNSQPSTNQRGFQVQDRQGFSLRQDLVLAAARHDAQLAYQLLAATKSLSQSTQASDQRNPRMQVNLDDNLEQTLLGRVAALDPKLAAQNAEQMMEKGQFPRTLGEVINRLQRQDAEAATKLAGKTVTRIQSANLLTNNEAGSLAQALLAPGPRLPAGGTTGSTADTKNQSQQARGPVLDPSLFTDLLSTVIDSALKATPQAQTNQRLVQRGPGGQRGQQSIQVTQQTDAQIEQNNARRLLAGLQTSLPVIDQYLPGRANAVRQKLTELGLNNTSRANFGQAINVLQQSSPTADALVQAAQAAPPPLQSRLYQQAATKAMDEGNADRARQIATDYLQGGQRDAMMQRIEFREMSKKAEGLRLDEIRQNVARLTNDSDKVSLLLEIAHDLAKDNPKAQLQVLEEARQVINHRAVSYDQFEDQLRVARAFADVDSSRSFDLLETGIGQLNELLSAASVLSGFEVNIFKDGEMNVSQGGSGLNSTIGRYGQELSLLAKTDFERSEILAGRFQFTEPRIMARLSIVQGALGVQPVLPTPNVIRNFGSATFMFRPN